MHGSVTTPDGFSPKFSLCRALLPFFIYLATSACGSSNNAVEVPIDRIPQQPKVGSQDGDTERNDDHPVEGTDLQVDNGDGTGSAVDPYDGEVGGYDEPIQSGPQPVVPNPNMQPLGFQWKGLLLTGDDSIRAFDNARKTLRNIFTQLGVDPRNIRELSRSVGEQMAGVGATNRQNMMGALVNLNVGPRDGCIIHMTSHGSRQGFYIRGQNTLSPSELDNIIARGCGNQPTIVLVSACYSGVFLGGGMQRPNRIILTAARPDRTSFGCSPENQFTYWDGCLINHLRHSSTWGDLYGKVRGCIQRKEAGGGFTPSEPQAFFGAALQNQPIFR